MLILYNILRLFTEIHAECKLLDSKLALGLTCLSLKSQDHHIYT